MTETRCILDILKATPLISEESECQVHKLNRYKACLNIKWQLKGLVSLPIHMALCITTLTRSYVCQLMDATGGEGHHNSSLSTMPIGYAALSGCVPLIDVSFCASLDLKTKGLKVLDTSICIC